MIYGVQSLDVSNLDVDRRGDPSVNEFLIFF
jgi:hypothetical protein